MSGTTQKSPRYYFDYNATAPLASGVAEAVSSALSLPGNPSSLHREGRRAQAVLDDARETVASCLGAGALDVVFTSGGTEANHLGLVGLSRTRPGVVMVSPASHPSLVSAAVACDGHPVMLPVQRDGTVELAQAAEQLRDAPPSIVAVSLVNHEIGGVEDIAALSELCREVGSLLFCDAVQGFGRVSFVGLTDLVDGLSVSAHKIGGPKGVGALWLRPGPAVEALVGGGKQESGRRPGTQALPLIAGFAAACRRLDERLADAPRQRELRDTLAAGLEMLGAVVGSSESGVCNTVSARFPGVLGDVVVTGLDLAGFAVSTGAACSSGTTEPSSVQLAIGLSPSEALEALRLSIGPATAAPEVEALLAALAPILERARRFG